MTLDVPLFAREISLFWVAPEVQWGGKTFTASGWRRRRMGREFA